VLLMLFIIVVVEDLNDEFAPQVSLSVADGRVKISGTARYCASSYMYFSST